MSASAANSALRRRCVPNHFPVLDHLRRGPNRNRVVRNVPADDRVGANTQPRPILVPRRMVTFAATQVSGPTAQGS